MKVKDKKNILNNFVEFLKKSKFSIFIVFLFLILTYWIRIKSSSFGIDTELYIEDYLANYNWWLGLERWGLVLLNKVLGMGPLIVPFSNLLTFIFIFIHSILLSYLFYDCLPEDRKSVYLKYYFIFPIVFFSSPIFAEQYNFILQNAAVSLAITFIPISLIIFNNFMNVKNKLLKYLLLSISIILTTISFATYQAIVSLFVLCGVCCYLLKCIFEKNNNFKYLIMIIIYFFACVVIYFIISKLFINGISYLKSGWKVSGINCIEEIWKAIKVVLKSETIFYNISLWPALFLLLLFNCIFVYKKNYNFGIFLGSIGLLFSPFYLFMITGSFQLGRTQFNYPFVIGFTYLLFVILFMNKKNLKYVCYVVVFGACLVAYKQVIITNSLFYSQEVVYESDVLYTNKIQGLIETKKDYDINKKYKLIFVGHRINQPSNLFVVGEVMGISVYDFDWQYAYGTTARANSLFKTIGYYYDKPSSAEFDFAKEYVVENNINVFPYEDSISFVNDMIIVRLSEEVN